MKDNYWSKKAVHIPKGAFRNKSDGRVYIKVSGLEGSNGRIVIGKAASEEEGLFYPNPEFATWFPTLWEEYFGYDPHPSEIHVGVCLAVQSIARRLRLQDMLTEIFGAETSNLLLDRAMFQILGGDDDPEAFEAFSRGDHLLFGEGPYTSDSAQFSGSNEDLERFRQAWIALCRKFEITECWLSMDGSNGDCLWAVCSNLEYPRLPVSCCMKGDPNQWHELESLLGESGMTVKGIMLDAEVCDTGVTETFQSTGYDFLIRLKEDVLGYQEMLQKHGREIFNSSRYMLPKSSGVFGIRDELKISAKDNQTSFVSLIFDTIKNCLQWRDLVDEWMKVEREVDEKNQEDHHAKPAKACVRIPEKFMGILSVRDQDGTLILECDYARMDSLRYTLGYTAYASSLPLSPKQMLHLYNLRQAFDNGPSGIVSFIAAVIRSEILRVCDVATISHSDLNTVISRLDQITIKLDEDNDSKSFAFTKIQKKVLEGLGIDENQISELSTRVKNRWGNPNKGVMLERGAGGKKRGRPRKQPSLPDEGM